MECGGKDFMIDALAVVKGVRRLRCPRPLRSKKTDPMPGRFRRSSGSRMSRGPGPVAAQSPRRPPCARLWSRRRRLRHSCAPASRATRPPTRRRLVPQATARSTRPRRSSRLQRAAGSAVRHRRRLHRLPHRPRTTRAGWPIRSGRVQAPTRSRTRATTAAVLPSLAGLRQLVDRRTAAGRPRPYRSGIPFHSRRGSQTATRRRCRSRTGRFRPRRPSAASPR